ncbi:MAG: hypothetical protein H6Q51_2802, partial [Deltaproteobacteria bacterium]|nr:hypothetical protein [Deltaproteobacteria bacterium]
MKSRRVFVFPTSDKCLGAFGLELLAIGHIEELALAGGHNPEGLTLLVDVID